MQKYFQQLLLLPGAEVGCAISRCDKHTPNFPWVRLPASINEVYEVGLTYNIARTSTQGAVTLSQKHCCAECGSAASPSWVPCKGHLNLMLHTENTTWVNRKKKKRTFDPPHPQLFLRHFFLEKIMSRVLHYEITNLCIYARFTCLSSTESLRELCRNRANTTSVML